MAIRLYVDQENTGYNSLFYRLLSELPQSVTLRLSDAELDVDYTDPVVLSAAGLTAFYTLNNEPTYYPDFSIPVNLVAATPLISTFQAYLSSVSSPGNFSVLELSAKVVSTIPVVSFVTFPSAVFVGTSQVQITPANLSTTSVLSFYGEGHTETFTLSSRGSSGSGLSAAWQLYNDDVVLRPTDLSGTVVYDLSTAISVPTSIGDYPTFNVSVQLFNSDFPIDGPLKRDGGTGANYPLYVTTEDFDSSTYTNLSGQISVQPYNVTASLTATTSLSANTELPFNYSSLFCTASARALSSTGTPIILSGGWDYEWELDAPMWTLVNGDQTNPRFDFYLRYGSVAGVPYTVTPSTSSIVTQTIDLVGHQILNYPPYDWDLKSVVMATSSFEVTILPRATPVLYALSPVYELSAAAYFENLTSTVQGVTSVIVDIEDSGICDITDKQVFTVIFNNTGSKTVTVSAFSSLGTYVETQPNLVQIITQYDTISASSYFDASNVVVELPHKLESIYVAPGDLVTAKSINSVLKLLSDNVDYLKSKTIVYDPSTAFMHGWSISQLDTPEVGEGYPIYTWEDVECPENNTVTWADLECATDDLAYAHWEYHTCGDSQDCLQKHCVGWTWRKRKCINQDGIATTWKNTKADGIYNKKWRYEPCEFSDNLPSNCPLATWRTNQPLLDRGINEIESCNTGKRCTIKGVAVTPSNDFLVVARNKEVQLWTNTYSPGLRTTITRADEITSFQNIAGIDVDSFGKIFTVDQELAVVSVYEIVRNTLRFANSWGGFGTINSPTGFGRPVHIHVDKEDKIWVTDSDNKGLKRFTSSGNLIDVLADSAFAEDTLVGCCQDSDGNLHVAGQAKVYVYNTNKELINTYTSPENIVGITAARSRECVYIASATVCRKYFKNGILCYVLPSPPTCLEGTLSLTGGVFHSRHRDLFLTAGSIVVRYHDRMNLKRLSSDLDLVSWSLEDLYIHPDEIVQDWVSERALRRMWDNIEFLRNSINYTQAKPYRAPKYSRDSIEVAYNEIVSAAILNRSVGYLKENLESILKYFEP